MLRALAEAGVLSPLDVQLARAAGRLAGEARPDVLLALALASRAPSAGHVCLELATARRAVRLEDAPDLDALPWPEPGAWLEALRTSPLVGDGEAATPLVLDGGLLYLHRAWRWQQSLVTALRARVAEGEVAGPGAWMSPAGTVDLGLLRSGLDRLFPATGDGVDRQRLAAAVAVLRTLTVITGGPGTGKTTTVLKVLALLAEQAQAGGGRFPPRIALAAPTGKAAARLAESVRAGKARLDADPALLAQIPDEATTIHRLLGWRPDRPGVVRHHAEDPIPADVLVIDEASMVDLGLMTRLLLAAPRRARVVLLGDRDQLASVESGAVLADLCGPPGAGRESAARGYSPAFAEVLVPLVGPLPPELLAPAAGPAMGDVIVSLVHTHRFGAASGIGALSRAINGGDVARTTGLLDGSASERPDGARHDDLRWIQPAATGPLPEEVERLVVAGLRPLVTATSPEDALAALDRFRLLCAHRRGPRGVEGVNEAAQGWLAAANLIWPRGAFWPGRPVLVTQNDPQTRLFNGDLGVVLPAPAGRLAVWFPGADGHPRPVSPAMLPPHETAFAMTVHKSQGSEVDHAMVVLPERASPVLTRELLYTGVTRARSVVTVVGALDVLTQAVTARVERASGLAEALWAP